MKVLSIVIPSFNMEKYLSRCLDSMLSATVLDSLEILVVNDGSTDNTSSIAHEYESKYPGTIKVIDKKNGHYGSAVNAGFAVAQGKYVRVIDADDWVNSAEFPEFLNALGEINTSDMVITNWSRNNKYTGVINHYHQNKNPYNQLMNIDDLQLAIDDIYYSFYGIIYLTDLINRIGYKQTEGVAYTDSEYSYYPAMEAKTVTFLDYDVYQYFIGREDQSVSQKVIKKNVRHFFKVFKRMVNTKVVADSKVKKIIQSKQMLLIARNLYYSLLIINRPSEIKDIDYKGLDKALKENYPIEYKLIGNLRYRHFPYVKFWRCFGLRLSGLYNFLIK